jgi:hypothetical protein
MCQNCRKNPSITTEVPTENRPSVNTTKTELDMETDPSVEEYPEEILHSSKQNQMPQ